MKYRVKKKQPNSKMCLVCGLKNRFGLRSFFYELDNNELLAIFKPTEEYQGYPDRLHGGIAASILDETIGRAILMFHSGNIWGFTVEFTIRFRKPIPLDNELQVIGRITKESSRIFEGTGELLLPQGVIAAEGYGRYMKIPLEKIANFDFEEQEWKVVSLPTDPEEIEIKTGSHK
jgi:acyl-coenzyme A thioesterase PaaI-like protein